MPSQILVKQTADFDANSTLAMLFDESPWLSTIAFAPGISVELDGVLRLDFAPDADPSSLRGRSFRLFDWTGVAPTGAFTIEHDPGLAWDTSQLITTGVVTLIPEPSTLGMAVLTLAFWMRRNSCGF